MAIDRLDLESRGADRRRCGFVILLRRWIVERTFAWLGNYRRFSKDYEQLPETSEAMIYGAMVHIMVRRLARNKAVHL